MSRTCILSSQVTISNNAPPQFDYDEYTTEILENRLEGSFVVAVGAKSRSTVTYRILVGNEKGKIKFKSYKMKTPNTTKKIGFTKASPPCLGIFAINPNSGVISTKGNIDYEEQNFFNLTVEATNMVSTSSNTSVGQQRLSKS